MIDTWIKETISEEIGLPPVEAGLKSLADIYHLCYPSRDMKLCFKYLSDLKTHLKRVNRRQDPQRLSLLKEYVKQSIRQSLSDLDKSISEELWTQAVKIRQVVLNGHPTEKLLHIKERGFLYSVQWHSGTLKAFDCDEKVVREFQSSDEALHWALSLK